MHKKKSKHTREHPFYKVAGFLLIIASVILACYYYLHSPIYRSQSVDKESAVQGATTADEQVLEPYIPQHETLTIRIPDGVNVVLEDMAGRKSGYSVQSHGFLNDIPFSEVVIGADGDKSLVIRGSLSPKYVLYIDGIARQEALSIELGNAKTGAQSELVSLDALGQNGAKYILTLFPLLIENSPLKNVQ